MKRKRLYTLTMFQMNENVEHFTYVKWTVVYGLATRRYISHYINKIYDRNRIQFFQAYKKSEYTKINLSLYTSETSDMLVKVAGIMAWSEEQNDPKYIFSLINKGYKYAWNFLKRHKRMNLPTFYESMKKEVHADESNFQAIMGIFVCSLMNYEVVVDIYESEENIKDEIEASTIAIGNILHFAKVNYEMMTNPSNFEFDMKNDDVIEFYDSLLSEWYINPKNETSLMKLIKSIKEEQMEQLDLDKYRGREYFEKLDEASKEVVFTGKSRLFTLLQLWFEIDGLSWYDLFENYKLKNDLYEKIAYFLYWGLEKGLICDEEKDLIFSYTIVLSALNASFQAAKQAHHENRIEEVEYEAQKREQRLNEKWLAKEASWKEQTFQLEEEICRRDVELEQCNKEIKQLRSELRKYETELEKMEQSKKELDALEAFQMMKEDDLHEKVSNEEMISYLHEKEIVIIGGHPNWHQKIKSIFPHFYIWEADDLHKDLTPIDDVDAVFIYWAYLSHPMYWKVKKQLMNSCAKLFFLEQNTNIDKTISQLYYSLQNH